MAMRGLCSSAPNSDVGAQSAESTASTIASLLRRRFVCFIFFSLVHYALHSFEKLSRHFKADDFRRRAVNGENLALRRFDGNLRRLCSVQDLGYDSRRLNSDQCEIVSVGDERALLHHGFFVDA